MPSLSRFKHILFRRKGLGKVKNSTMPSPDLHPVLHHTLYFLTITILSRSLSSPFLTHTHTHTNTHTNTKGCMQYANRRYTRHNCREKEFKGLPERHTHCKCVAPAIRVKSKDQSTSHLWGWDFFGRAHHSIVITALCSRQGFFFSIISRHAYLGCSARSKCNKSPLRTFSSD